MQRSKKRKLARLKAAGKTETKARTTRVKDYWTNPLGPVVAVARRLPVFGRRAAGLPPEGNVR